MMTFTRFCPVSSHRPLLLSSRLRCVRDAAIFIKTSHIDLNHVHLSRVKQTLRPDADRGGGGVVWGAQLSPRLYQNTSRIY